MKNQFDEMQQHNRNKIGSQSFSLLVLLLMLDNAAYQFGFQWIAYPMNVFILVIACCGINIVRLALSGSFVAPRQNIARSAVITGVTIIVSMAVTFYVSGRLPQSRTVPEQTDSFGAFLLIAVSWGALLSVAVISFLKHRRDRKNDE